MKQYTLRELYKGLGKALEEVPFEITNHNRVVARVVGVGVPIAAVSQEPLPDVTLVSGGSDRPTRAVRIVSKKESKKEVSVPTGLCKHGAFGYCVHGCFK